MARRKKGGNSTPQSPMTAMEKKAFVQEQDQKNLKNFQSVLDAAIKGKPLRDVTKSTIKSIKVFDKDTLRGYLKNVGSNEVNLRKLSMYLFYRSHVYYRLISFYADMFCLNARKVIPKYNLTKTNDKSKFLKSYNDTIDILDNMNLQGEMRKIYMKCFSQDVSYNIVFYDETGMFLYGLDPDYCKIDGQYFTGDFSFSMNMSYWRSKTTELEALGSPLVDLYNEYDKTGEKWQHIPDEYAACFKFRNYDWEICVPPLIGSFLSFINIEELADIQAIADEQQIYKLIYLPMKTIQGSNNPDDWEISIDIMLEYFDLIQQALPYYTDAVIVPGDELKTISFDSDSAKDVTKVQDAIETTLNTTGGAEVLNGSKITSSAAFSASMKANTKFAISSLLPQTQSWVNRFLSYKLKNPAKVEFFECSIYTIEDLRKSLLEGAQFGLPNQLLINNLNQITEKQTMALNFLEQSCLGINNLFKPMSSSYTQTGNVKDTTTTDTDPITGGAPKKDDSEISESGDRMRNQ